MTAQQPDQGWGVSYEEAACCMNHTLYLNKPLMMLKMKHTRPGNVACCLVAAALYYAVVLFCVRGITGAGFAGQKMHGRGTTTYLCHDADGCISLLQLHNFARQAPMHLTISVHIQPHGAAPV